MTRPREHGIVLVAVLFAVTVMSVLVVAATASMRSGISSEQLEQRRLATQLALRSGLESAKALILAASVPERAFLDGTPVPVDLGNGIVAEVGVRDAAGLADLNASDPALIAALLARDLAAGEAAELSSRIAAWRSQAPPAILSVSQLQALVKPEAGASLARHVTVFNPAGLINPLAAPDHVLLAIPGVTPADVRAVKSARRARTEQGLGALLTRLKSFLAVREAKVFMIGVELREGPGVIARSRAEAVVQPLAEGPLPFRTLAVSGL